MRPSGPSGAYSSAFLDHLTHPRRQGALAQPTHRGETVDAVCADRLTLDLRVEGGVVTDARFRVEGCPGAIAVGSVLASLVPGRAALPGSIDASDLEAELAGVPPSRRHALRLALEAWKSALRSPLG